MSRKNGAKSGSQAHRSKEFGRLESRLKLWSGIISVSIICLMCLSAVMPIVPVVHAQRTIVFSGYTWIVKTGEEMGPGNNYWSDSGNSVWVDSSGQLHLKVRYADGRWYCSEVYLANSLGYGQYVFYAANRVDSLKTMMVNGLFLYQDDDHEVDFEFSKWGDATHNFNAQYVVSPSSEPNHLHRFMTTLKGDYSTHVIKWAPKQLRFQSIQGRYSTASTRNSLIQNWTYQGSVARALNQGSERLHINLWIYGGCPAGTSCEQEVVIAAFEFKA